MTEYVIHRKNLPTRIPLPFLAIVWLLLDRFGAPGWAFGVFWTLAVILLAACGVALYQERWVSIRPALKHMAEMVDEEQKS